MVDDRYQGAGASVCRLLPAGERRSWVVTCLAAVLAHAACGPVDDRSVSDRDAPPSDALGGSDLRFVAVTHGVAADPFWAVVANGMADAAAEMGVDVDYQAITTFDMVAMSHLIDAAVASRPDGLVVSWLSPGPFTWARGCSSSTSLRPPWVYGSPSWC